MEDEIGTALEAGHFTSQERRVARTPGARELRRRGAHHAVFRICESCRHTPLRSGSAGAASSAPASSRRRIASRPCRRPGLEKVPFFLIRVDPAGNISKLLDGAGFPFAKHGGACPLWSVHGVFKTPRQIVTQWLELPDGQRVLFHRAHRDRRRRRVRRRPRGARHRASVVPPSTPGQLIYTAMDGAARGRADAGRRRMPRLPSPEMRGAIAASDRPRASSRRFQAAERSVRVLHRLSNRPAPTGSG